MGEDIHTDIREVYENGNHVPNGVTETAKNDPKDKSKDKKKKEKANSVSTLQLFRFADKWDIILIVIGLICSCAHGCALPVMVIVFGQMTTTFTNSSYISENLTEEARNSMLDSFMTSIKQSSIYYAIIGCIVLVVGYVQVTTFLISSYRQVFKMRRTLFSSALHQEIGWFDTNDSGELSTRLSDDINKIQEGLGDKISTFFQWIATFVSGLIIGLVFGWKLALVVISVSPLLAISGGVMTYMITNATNKELTAYAKAGSVANEVFTAVRTVVAFGGQEKEINRYYGNLEEAKKFGIRKGMANGAGMGMVHFIMFSSYALAFWYGGKLVRENEIPIGNMLIVFFCVIIGAFALGNAGPTMQSVGTAKGAAYNLWKIMDRKSKIDSSKSGGKKLDSIEGNIEFRNIHFQFPSREEIKVLRGLNMKIDKGQTVAVVGGSGCGKSTVIQLLQRFYDPVEGSVFIDGTDIKEMNVKWLRQQIGIVSQEPVLFATTIAENISYGCDGVTQEQIEAAAKEANAHDFISKLPEKYETMVGERGAQLSGGQKQRIAIARALVKNPKIILLDEATSALDTESESTVQAALDKAQSGRTTIVVAHRLSTIKNADVIFGIKDGVVHESGTHDELMELGGIYYQLVTNQTMQETEEDENETGGEELTDIPLNNFERKLSVRERKLSFKGEELEINDQTKDLKTKEKDVSIIRVFRYNKPEWYIILIGCFAAIIQGGIQPSFAIIFARFLGIFSAGNDEETRERQVILYACLFIALGVAAGISMFTQATMFAISGERLTKRIRRLLFKNLLRQNISFFDDHNNGVGALTTRLATDASAVQGFKNLILKATGVRLGMAFQSFASVGVGIIIGFVYSWQLTLLIMACVPFIMAASMLQMKLAKGFSGNNNSALETSGKLASEVLSNIRTVAALTKEDKFENDYCDLLAGPHKLNLKKSHLYGISFSFSQSLIYFAYAAIFSLGAYLIKQGLLDYERMFTVFGAIIFGAMSLGQASQFAPDFAKAKAAVNRIFSLIYDAPPIDVYSNQGIKPNSCKGSIKFKGVTFAYPTRKSVKVLKQLNLAVQPGSTVALVGSSGCGKSTTIQLLERFYDVLSGNILLDENDLKSLNIAWLRAQMGLVSQEPILFDCSIRENIAYGDNSRQVEMSEIIQAARMANIANFIDSLPQGYETGVGDKGTQLSGGQKQRIAIARALVRNPKILLLDEATSALDTESEKIVQEALDRAQEGRTSLVIAHRLSTIQNADCIFVFHNGVVSELGTHSELMAQKGIYYKLNMAQGQRA